MVDQDFVNLGCKLVAVVEESGQQTTKLDEHIYFDRRLRRLQGLLHEGEEVGLHLLGQGVWFVHPNLGEHVGDLNQKVRALLHERRVAHNGPSLLQKPQEDPYLLVLLVESQQLSNEVIDQLKVLHLAALQFLNLSQEKLLNHQPVTEAEVVD